VPRGGRPPACNKRPEGEAGRKPKISGVTILSTFPEHLFDFAFISDINARLQTLAEMAEPEDWEYKETPSARTNPILFNYFTKTYSRLSEEEKIEVSDNAEHTAFDTGLVTPNQERIFAFFGRNQIPNQQPWFLLNWCLPGERVMNDFGQLPVMAHYFDDPTALVYDVRKPLRVNVEHIIADNRERFPARWQMILLLFFKEG